MLPNDHPETIRVVNGYIEIFGGDTGLSEESPYEWRWEQVETGQGLANFLRQVSDKAWAHPELMKRLIHAIADWFDSAIEREMERMMKENQGGDGDPWVAGDYFASCPGPCPECEASVKPRTPGVPLEDGRTVASFYECEGPDRHQLASMSDTLPTDKDGARYRLVLQAQ